MGAPTNNLGPGVAITPSSVIIDRPKASFSKDGFDTLIRQKGYSIYLDRTIKCPCAETISHQALPGCRNCGGTGYVSYNRIETHAIMHSMNKDSVFKDWSELLLGTASMTTYHEVGMSYMDKVTLREGESIHNELLNLTKYDDGIWRSGLMYPMLHIQAMFLFEAEDTILKPLQLGLDYVLEKSQVVRFTNIDLLDGLTKPTLSVRYTHRPEFYVIDIPRKTIASLSRDPKTKVESSLYYPVHAILRVPHYVLNMDSNNGEYLLDNTFKENSCRIKTMYINGIGIDVNSYTQEEIDRLTPYTDLVVWNSSTEEFWKYGIRGVWQVMAEESVPVPEPSEEEE